jgi:hypothetical protein
LEHSPIILRAAALAAALSFVSACGRGDPLPSEAANTIPSGNASGGVLPKEILYVNDGQGGRTYNYESGAYYDTIKYIDSSEGNCVDANGDLYITNDGVLNVLEYRRGEVHPIKFLKTHGTAISCSIAPNGDLAVADYGTSPHNGNVVVFKAANGTPKKYTSNACSSPEAVGYDGAGNLYVEQSSYQTSTICELPNGGTSMTRVTSNVKINEPGGVMWDGAHITLTDSGYDGYSETAIYQMKEDGGGNLTKVGQTILTEGACGRGARLLQPFMVGSVNTPRNKRLASSVVGASFAYGCSDVSVWKYPQGGTPTRKIKTGESRSRDAVSIAP